MSTWYRTSESFAQCARVCVCVLCLLCALDPTDLCVLHLQQLLNHKLSAPQLQILSWTVELDVPVLPQLR